MDLFSFDGYASRINIIIKKVISSSYLSYYNMEKQKKIDNLIRKFSEKMFKLTPEIIGMNILGVAEKKKNEKFGDLKVSGYYVENKNFRDAEDEK